MLDLSEWAEVSVLAYKRYPPVCLIKQSNIALRHHLKRGATSGKIIMNFRLDEPIYIIRVFEGGS